MGYEAFSVVTPEGKKKERIQLKEEFEPGVLVRNLQDISIELRAKRHLCHIEVEDVPAFGYKTYHLERKDEVAYCPGTLAPETNVLENEYLRATFNSDGTIDLTHKETRKTYAGIHYIEDTGETGHTWVHMEPDENETITSHGGPVSIALEEAGPIFARMRVTYRMMIPSDLTTKLTAEFREAIMNHTARNTDYVEMIVTSRFTLRAGARRLDVTTELDNPARHHRVRVVFPTGLAAKTTESEAGFDVISRDIHVKKGNAYYGRPNPQYPMHRFVDMTDGKAGFAVLNSTGMREYEAMDTEDRPLAITLFRAFTYRNCPIFGRYEVYPEMELAQCPGHFEWTYALYPHVGDWTHGVFEQAERLNLPLEAAQAGPHKGNLPKTLSFLQIKGKGLQLSAFKRAEDRKTSYIVRLFNPTNKAVSGELVLFKSVKKAWRTNLNEERQEELKPDGRRIKLRVTKKKIETIEFVL